MKIRNLLTICLLVSICLVFSVCRKQPKPSNNGFNHVAGTKIVDANNDPIRLQGIAFGNEVWSDKELPYTDHSEIDFTRVKEMGMNCIRFYMNYKTFESDAAPYQYKESGWIWLDQNINWAKKNGIYLILNLHIPQGGFQSQGNSDALWTNLENQNRLTALWKAIANRYKDETQIMGYGLVNEPIPTNDISQWQQLAQRIRDEIRTVDKNHILFIERANAVKGKNETADYNFPAINDNNTAYEFHVYDPFQFTHQLFNWANPNDGGKYPDESIIIPGALQWYTAIFNNPVIPAGNTNWQYFEGIKYKITDPNCKIGLPALVATNVNGRVYYDDIEIKEYDANGNFIQSIVSLPLSSPDEWSFWSRNNSGIGGAATNTGTSNNTSIYIEAATDDCNYSNYNKVFVPKQGYYYQINGWMKGENIAANAGCKLRIDFFNSNDPIQTRNKTYLETILKKYADWGRTKNVPMYMGEFGAGIHCFENNKGGVAWVNDMIDIANANNIYFTYHDYHEDNFGLYYGYGSLPDPTQYNQPLMNLFKQKFK